MSFFQYRIAEVFVPIEGQGGVSSRFVAEFSADGVTWRATSFIVYQNRLEAQQAIGEIISAEDTFVVAVQKGSLGTLSAYYNYPPG
jgi:hypothetical protein